MQAGKTYYTIAVKLPSTRRERREQKARIKGLQGRLERLGVKRTSGWSTKEAAETWFKTMPKHMQKNCFVSEQFNFYM